MNVTHRNNQTVQHTLFDFDAKLTESPPDDRPVGKSVVLPNADINFYENFFGKRESSQLFDDLLKKIRWRSDKIKLYGKEFDLPRKTAWYGDPDRPYTYSGIHLEPEQWTKPLLTIKSRIEVFTGGVFNSVMLNLYRDGSDGISWHTDAEPELGENPTIGSVSFGETRRFMLRHKYEKNLKTEFELSDGSFLLMSGQTQHYWLHQIPKTTRKLAPRINLTFRFIYPQK